MHLSCWFFLLLVSLKAVKRLETDLKDGWKTSMRDVGHSMRGSLVVFRGNINSETQMDVSGKTPATYLEYEYHIEALLKRIEGLRGPLTEVTDETRFSPESCARRFL